MIHEFAGFLFVGHTLFSNIWAMRIRMTMGQEAGVWARGFLRKLALGITFPMSIISPVAGLFADGVLRRPARRSRWAWDAYLAILADGRRQHRAGRDSLRPQPQRRRSASRRLSGAIRGNFGTLMVIWILWCMITKQALFAG